jgi:hypothetical protein
MNESSINPREQLDLLISRIADGEAGENDWAAFTALAETDAGGAAWRQLAQAQKDHGAMSLAVGVALHAADRVELPTAEAAALWTRRAHAPRHIRTLTRFGAWSGWAAAAMVALAWFGGFGSGRGSISSPPNAAGWSIKSPDDAVKAYLDVGRRQGSVIGEMPNRVLVDSQPTVMEGGQRGIAVVYVRQFVERAVVSDMARLGFDETGRCVPVPVPAQAPASARWSPQ